MIWSFLSDFFSFLPYSLIILFYHAQQHNYEKFSPTTQQYSNIKIINKNFRFSKHYILETCNQHLIELIFKPVLTYLNVFSYWNYLQNYI